MISALIQYNRLPGVLPLADDGENVGKIGLGILRLGFGKTVLVSNDTSKASGLAFQEIERPLIIRIAAIALVILALTNTLLLVGIGLLVCIGSIGLAYSNTQSSMYSAYLNQDLLKQDPSTQKEPFENTFPDQKQPPKKEGEKAFTRKFTRAPNLDFNSIHGKPMLLTALEHLQKSDPLVKRILETWLIFEQQKPGQQKLSLLDMMANQIKGGTCYGQAMNILELVRSQNQEEISEEFLAQNMHWKHYVYYQIVHILHVFTLNQKCAYVSGVNVKDAQEKLESLLPHYNKGKEHSKWNIAKLNHDWLVGDFSDLIKHHIRSRDASGKQNYAIQITFTGKEKGHAAIIYYNEIHHRYFWYDPYMPDSGLFSTEDAGEFYKGVAAKLLEYKNSPDFTHFSFTAYKVGKD